MQIYIDDYFIRQLIKKHYEEKQSFPKDSIVDITFEYQHNKLCAHLETIPTLSMRDLENYDKS